jgi:hypothetical protein
MNVSYNVTNYPIQVSSNRLPVQYFCFSFDNSSEQSITMDNVLIGVARSPHKHINNYRTKLTADANYFRKGITNSDFTSAVTQGTMMRTTQTLVEESNGSSFTSTNYTTNPYYVTLKPTSNPSGQQLIWFVSANMQYGVGSPTELLLFIALFNQTTNLFIFSYWTTLPFTNDDWKNGNFHPIISHNMGASVTGLRVFHTLPTQMKTYLDIDYGFNMNTSVNICGI